MKKILIAFIGLLFILIAPTVTMANDGAEKEKGVITIYEDADSQESVTIDFIAFIEPPNPDYFDNEGMIIEPRCLLQRKKEALQKPAKKWVRQSKAKRLTL